MVAAVLLGGVHARRGMGIGDQSSAALVVQIRSGDAGAESELVKHYQRGVLFVIGRSVMDSTVAEDLYQETFRLVLEKVRGGEVREPERLSGFVVSVARNLVIDYFRRSARAASREEDLGAQAIALPEPGPLDRLLSQERAMLARRVLSEMTSERDRKVLYRFYIADDDKEEICADLGISSLHFNQILCRARERYRKLFEEMSGTRGTVSSDASPSE